MIITEYLTDLGYCATDGEYIDVVHQIIAEEGQVETELVTNINGQIENTDEGEVASELESNVAGQIVLV